MSMVWLEDALHTIGDMEANCAIFCGHHACKQTWSVISLLRTELMKRAGVPVLCLQGDSWSRTITPIGVIQGEIEEFVNNVVRARRRKRARTADGGERR